MVDHIPLMVPSKIDLAPLSLTLLIPNYMENGEMCDKIGGTLLAKC